MSNPTNLLPDDNSAEWYEDPFIWAAGGRWRQLVHQYPVQNGRVSGGAQRQQGELMLLEAVVLLQPAHPLLLCSEPQPAHQFATGGYGENVNETDVFAPWAFGGLADPACEGGRGG